MAVRLGTQTMRMQRPPAVVGNASLVGPKEGEGPLCWCFDEVMKDDLLGESSWEKAECKMFRQAIETCIKKSGVPMEQLQVILGGDLLNQIITASFAARDLERPFLGLYNACSTMAESLLVGSLLLDGGGFDNAVCVTASHFCTAERQYRFPLELGNQRTPTSQWTVTGAGATLLARQAPGNHPIITSCTVGKVVDMGITDANNMGAAMAPSAADTLSAHLRESKRTLADYDLIVTGDLGQIGWQLMAELCARQQIKLTKDNYVDCGCEIFTPSQDPHAGGSGCGCSAVVLNGLFIEKLRRKELSRILFIATGALLSPTSSLQGESIPGIAHAVCIEAPQ